MEVQSTDDRIIVLVDMDCFYVQVEQKLCPEFHNKPCAVVQYKAFKGGGIIAVNYEARAKGITRLLRGDDAVKMCPDIHLFRVPEVRGKADLTRYREAGALVIDVLCEYSDCVERASIDEAYLDMTSIINTRLQNSPRVTSEQLKNTFVVGWEGEDIEAGKEELEKWLQMIYEEEHLYHDRMLALAAVIVEEMRTAVYEKTGYRCSAGIAHNKMLAKLSCGLHKPNKQTVLPQSSIQLLFKTMPIKKVRNLGGKLGEAIVKRFSVEKMGDLIDIPKSQFVNQFGEKTGHWLYKLVRGVDNEPVTSRQLPKSIGCGKNFPGKSSLSTRNEVVHWLKQLATELEERLLKDQNDNRRFARLLTISTRTNENGAFSMVSRSCPINVYNAEKLAHDALLAINKLNTTSSDTLWKPSIWTLSMAASKFEDRLDNSHCNIESYFTNKVSGNKEILNQTETTSSKSVASTSTEGTNETRISECEKEINKTESLNKTIMSFFAKKQVTETGSFLKDEKVEVTTNENEKEELDSCLSTCNTTNILGTTCNEVSDAKSTAVSSAEENSRTILSDKQSITSFFTMKEAKEESFGNEKKVTSSLNESEKKNVDAFLFDGPNCSGDEFIVTRTKDTFSIGEASKTVSPDKQSKPLGFFAKKLKERSECNFDIEFETSCDSLTNESLNRSVTFQNNNSSLEVPLSNQENEQSSCTISDTYTDLDPELTKVCEQCSKRIPVWEETEHLDYHMALTLSKEFSSKPSTNNSSIVSKTSITGKNIVSKSKSSRKRGSAIKSSSQSKKPVIQSKTLDAFFK